MNLGILDHANKLSHEKSILIFSRCFLLDGKGTAKRLCLDRKQLYQKGIHGTHARWSEAIHFGLYAEG